MNKKEINWEILNGILQCNANKRQCADILRMSEDTIERRIKSEHKMTFDQYRETKMGVTKVKLQQKAVTLALEGNVTMLIFCLKNFCGWSDQKDVGTQDFNVKLSFDKQDSEL